MIGEMVALLVGEHVNLLDRLGVLGDGGARTERGREIDGRATRVLYSTVREKKGWKSMINPIALWLKERAGQSTLDGYLDETYRESMEGEARSY